jgi:GrpB-like predicted nucleotidyltransferase (UPF0157 family)
MSTNLPIVVEYDPAWASEFEAISSVLASALGPLATAIHHVGSTSIPGMCAKPILDIDIEMAPGAGIDAVSGVLATLGYTYEGEMGIVDRHAYRRLSPGVPYSELRPVWMEQHVYACPARSVEMARHLKFRDRLRASADLRHEYRELKDQALSMACGVRQVYVDEKEKLGNEFFERVIGS